jgi:hypothetical protein
MINSNADTDKCQILSDNKVPDRNIKKANLRKIVDK